MSAQFSSNNNWQNIALIWRMVFIGLLLLIMPHDILAKPKPEPLPVEQAFSFTASVNDPQTIIAHWKIAPSYYLYRDRIHFKALSPEHLILGKPIFPIGIAKQNSELGAFQVYQQKIDIAVPVIKPNTGNINLLVSYQGCSSAGFCYPPLTKALTLNLSGNFHELSSGTIYQPASTSKPSANLDLDQDSVTQLLAKNNLFIIIISCIGFGLLLAFTPCVLPMIPILSGIILGHDKTLNTAKALRLSLTYVVSMSITYALAGLIIGWLGSNIQAALQQPWIIALFSLIFVGLALSLFGYYELQLPKSIQTRLAQISHTQKSGHYLGVAIMGCLATLIVSPCVTPPLVGILGYIGQSGNALLGGIALFSLSFGMGIPLILIAVSGGKWLPKAGAWMVTIKAILGVMLLAVAITLLQRILPPPVTLFLWGTLLIISAIFLGALNKTVTTNSAKLTKGLGFILLIYGVLQIIGAAYGNSDPLQPLAVTPTATASLSSSNALVFQPIKTPTQLQEALTVAKQQNRPVLVDFYADWCTACKLMAKTTFTDPSVRQALQPFTLLQVDVTANTDQDQALLKQLNVIAPPTLVFYNANGNEVPQARVTGEIAPRQLLLKIAQVTANH